MDEKTVKNLTKEIGDLNRLVSTAEKLLRRLQTGNIDKETKEYQKEIKEIIKKTKSVLDGDATRKDTKALQELISTSQDTLRNIKENNKDNEEFNRSFKRLFGSSHTAGSIAHSMRMSVKDMTDAISSVSNEALSDATDTALDFLPGVKLATKLYDISGITSAVGNTIRPNFGNVQNTPRIEDAFTGPEEDDNVIRPTDFAPSLDRMTKDDISEQLRQMREDMAVSVGLDKFGDVTQDKIAVNAEQEELKDAVLGTATSELQERQIEQDKSLAEMREDSDQRRHLTQQQSMDTLIAAVKGLTKSLLARIRDWYRRQIDEWKENPLKKFMKTGIQTLLLPITMMVSLFKWFRKRKSEHQKTRDTIMGSGEMIVRAIKGMAAKRAEGGFLAKQLHKWQLKKAEEYKKLQDAGFELSKRQAKHLNKMRMYMAEPPPRPQPIEQIRREQRIVEALDDIKDNTEGESKGGVFGFGGDFLSGLAGKIKTGLMTAMALAFKGTALVALGGTVAYGISKLLSSWLVEPINNWIKDKFGWDPLTNIIGKWVTNMVAWMEQNIPGFKWLTGGEASRAVEFNKQNTYDKMIAKRKETEALVMPWERDLERRENERKLKALEAQRQLFASGIHADPERLAQVNAQIAQIKQTMPVKAERDGVKVELPKGDGEKDKAVIDSMREVADSVKESNDKLVDAVRKLTENIAQSDLGVPLDNELIREIKSLTE